MHTAITTIYIHDYYSWNMYYAISVLQGFNGK